MEGQVESLVLGEWLGGEGIEGVVETSVILAVVSDWIDGDSINPKGEFSK